MSRSCRPIHYLVISFLAICSIQERAFAGCGWGDITCSPSKWTCPPGGCKRPRNESYINDPQPSQEELYRQEMLRRQQIDNQQRQERIRQENLRRQQEQQRQQEQLRLQERERQRQLLIQQNQSRREQEIRNLRLNLDNMLRTESLRCKSYADSRVSAALGQLTYGQGLPGSEMNRIGTNAFNECMFPVRQRVDQIYNYEMQRINSIRY